MVSVVPVFAAPARRVSKQIMSSNTQRVNFWRGLSRKILGTLAKIRETFAKVPERFAKTQILRRNFGSNEDPSGLGSPEKSWALADSDVFFAFSSQTTGFRVVLGRFSNASRVLPRRCPGGSDVSRHCHSHVQTYRKRRERTSTAEYWTMVYFDLHF